MAFSLAEFEFERRSPDPGLMEQLHFGETKLPRVDLYRSETYESLFHLLKDLEALLKAWKKRAQNPEADHMMSSPKDLWSISLYREIFDTEDSFHRALQTVVSGRKSAEDKAFSVFYDALPDHWVKQLSMDISKKVFDYALSPPGDLHMEFKSTTGDYLTLEEDRIKDSFLLAGRVISTCSSSGPCSRIPASVIILVRGGTTSFTVSPPSTASSKAIGSTSLAFEASTDLKKQLLPCWRRFDEATSQLLVKPSVAKSSHRYFSGPDIMANVNCQTGNGTGRLTVEVTIVNLRENKIAAKIHIEANDVGRVYPGDFHVTANRLAWMMTLEPTGLNDYSSPLFCLKYWRFDPNADTCAVLHEKDIENGFNVGHNMSLCSEPRMIVAEFRASCLRGKEVYVVSQIVVRSNVSPQTWIFLVDADTCELIHGDDGRQSILY